MKLLKNYDLIIEVIYDINGSITQICADDNLDIPNLEYGNFDAFLINLEHLFTRNGFKIKEHHGSNNKRSISQYYAIYPANDNSVIYDILIILRISDHQLPRGVNHGLKYFDQYAQDNKYPLDKTYQDWELRQIILNGKSVHNYRQGLHESKQIIQEWSQNNEN